ncbi:MAG: hypothetical protein QM820_20705 [Minicystis sp.]
MKHRLCVAFVVALVAGCGSRVDIVNNTGGAGGSSGVGTAGSTGPGGASIASSGAGAGSTGVGASPSSSSGEGGAGAGPASSSSGAGGSPMTCPGFGDPCTECASVACPAIYCACSDNPQCFAFSACLQGCNGDMACTQMCQTAHEDGISDLYKLSDCAGMACATECPKSKPLDPCLVCALDTCPAALNACLAEPECVALYNCLVGCGNVNLTCQQQCYADHGAGTNTLQALLQCETEPCGSVCK